MDMNSYNIVTQYYRESRMLSLPFHCNILLLLLMIVILSNVGERKVFTWGRGDYGQLGRDVRSKGANQTICCPTPVEVPTLKNVRQVSNVL